MDQQKPLKKKGDTRVDQQKPFLKRIPHNNVLSILSFDTQPTRPTSIRGLLGSHCTNFIETAHFKLPASGGLRVRKLLDMKAPNGDLTHTRDHLHWSLLTARPVFWDSLMRLINQECPGTYTPPDKPQISSYKFGMPRNPDEGQLKKLFPCLPAYFSEFDGTQNYWLTRCLWCRNLDKNKEKQFTKHLPNTISWLQQTVFPELHARDVAMKWAYVGRRLVYEI